MPGDGAWGGKAAEIKKGQRNPLKMRGIFIIFIAMMVSHMNANSKFGKLYNLLCVSYSPSVLGLLIC